MKPDRLNLLKPFARTAVAAAFTLALLSACMVGPDFEKPAAPVSQDYDAQAEHRLGGTDAPAGSQHIDLDEKIDGDWWSAFGSAKLDRVMHQAIDGNLDLEAADATLAQAQEAVAATRGGLSPQLDFGAQAGRERAIRRHQAADRTAGGAGRSAEAPVRRGLPDRDWRCRQPGHPARIRESTDRRG